MPEQSAKMLFCREIYYQSNSGFPELYRALPLCVNTACGLITVMPMPRIKRCENCSTENTFVSALRSRKCVTCKKPMSWMHEVTCKNCGTTNEATSLELSTKACLSCKKPLLWTTNPELYIPNKVPLRGRIIFGVISILLIVLSVQAIFTQRIAIPYGGKYSRGVTLEFIGPEIAFPVLAIILAAIGFLAVVVDHYDKRFNEETYKIIANICIGVSLTLYIVSIFIGHRIS
jgi:hypothetical protein